MNVRIKGHLPGIMFSKDSTLDWMPCVRKHARERMASWEPCAGVRCFSEKPREQSICPEPNEKNKEKKSNLVNQQKNR